MRRVDGPRRSCIVIVLWTLKFNFDIDVSYCFISAIAYLINSCASLIIFSEIHFQRQVVALIQDSLRGGGPVGGWGEQGQRYGGAEDGQGEEGDEDEAAGGREQAAGGHG